MPTFRTLVQVTAAACSVLLAVSETRPGRAGMIDKEGMQPWEVCALCHSLNGVSRTAKFPHLAGQRASYIRKQLMDFRAGRRANDSGQMANIAGEELKEADIGVVAEYFSSLTLPAPAAGTPDEEPSGRGKALFEKGAPERGIQPCILCHGGEAPAIEYAPRIRAQHADYIAKQLTDFRTGARTNDATRTMTQIAARLSDAEIRDLATFVASQPRAVQ